MAERSQADQDDRGAKAVSERSLFVDRPDILANDPALLPGYYPMPPAPNPPAPPRPPSWFPWRRAEVAGSRRRPILSARHLLADATKAAAIEFDRGLVFLLVPVFLAGGVILYFSLPAEPGWMQPSATALALAVLSFSARRRSVLQLVFGMAFLVALGVVVAKLETWRVGGQMIGAEISTRLTGRVVSIDDMANGRVRLTVDVVSTARPKLLYQPARVRLSARALEKGIAAGSIVSGFARLLPPTGPVRPDSYDFSFDSYFAGIGASGFFLTDPKPVPGEPAPLSARFQAAVEDARDGIADHIRASIGGPQGEIAAALIVGVRAGIPEGINEAMRKTGIYHIISISGLHMALVAGTVMVLLRGVFALFPGFSSRRAVKKYAAAAALFAIAAYLVISGIVVAAERSFIMLAVMLTAVLFDRAALTMRNLAISAIAVILVSPHEVVGPSFQMSFAATAALVGAYAGWSDRRDSRPGTGPPPPRSLPVHLVRRFITGMMGIAMTSVIAGGATTLYAMWHFQRVAPLSLFANLAVMPIVSLVVMPFAVVAAVFMPFGADFPFLYVMGKGLTAMIAVSGWLAAHSPIDAVGLVSGQSVLFVTVALVIATMATTWLRALALPFALAGLLTVHQVRTPDVLVSEDGRLVALPIGGSELAVSRAQPNKFTVDNWRRALDAEAMVPPEVPKGADARFVAAHVLDLPPGAPFLCMVDLCLARHPSGAFVATAKTAKAARAACAWASLIVIGDAAGKNPCGDPLVRVITARDVARWGSAAVYFDPDSAAAPPAIRFAVEQAYRPWHVQRKFSRAARGLAPYERQTGKEQRQ
jgi:competence protein ComEC